MAVNIRIAVDAMGGDNAPSQIVLGVVNAVNHIDNVSIILVGRQEEIEKELSGKNYPQGRITVLNATDVIGTAEHPVEAVRHKKDSSLVVGMQTVRKGDAEAFVSAGNSGAVVVGGQGIIGRIRGVMRPAFATMIPTRNGAMLLLDCGANVDVRPEIMAQWAKLGSIYMESAAGVMNPRVGIVNIGAEEEKGNNLVKETYPYLKEMGENGEINFIGSCEARDIPEGPCDVVVCDGFTGNVVIKMYEGTAKVLLSEMKRGFLSSLRAKIGAALILPVLKTTLGKFDPSRYGGAPILGLKSLVVKMHGSAKAKEVERAIEQCVQFYGEDITGKIQAYAERSGKTDVKPQGGDVKQDTE